MKISETKDLLIDTLQIAKYKIYYKIYNKFASKHPGRLINFEDFRAVVYLRAKNFQSVYQII